ncbi:50S ribosomal protein L20 [Spirobacillus cienkowskii]|jgi:large subunit ribosomal protein L20|uniref:Large ribosomal subunit protein bL20 n=1 Tax=Spirobacillus cienkowskii TaxID=495820 RepID=A0A369KTQ2_9BACT|nr:MAG: 50S ribosomal protein L20 [Spirobacillus cienkowskii]
MARVKRGFKLRRRHKKVLKLAKGYRGTRSKLYRTAIQIVRRALCYAYRDRKVKKRDFRALWIQRINAAARAHGMPYSKFMNGLKKANIVLDRKQLSEIAIQDGAVFEALVKKSMAALSK